MPYGYHKDNPAGIGPAGIGPAGIGPAGIGPAGIGPAGIGPAGIGPAGIGPAGIGPAGIGPAGIGERRERAVMTMSDIREDLATALRYHRSGRSDRAEPIYRSIVETDPGCAEAWHLLGVIEVQRGDARASESHVRRAIRLDGRQPKYHNTLGSILVALGHLAEAEACLRRALDLDAGFVNARFNLGHVLGDLGRADDAEEAYRRTLELNPGHVDALNNLGLQLLRRRRVEEAEDCFRRAEAVDPDNVAVLWNLTSCLEQRNKVEDAYAFSQRLSLISPDDPAAGLIAARLERRNGRPTEAAERLERVLAATTEDGLRLNAYYELGLALDRLDRSRDAFAAFESGNQLARAMSDARGIDGPSYIARVRTLGRWFTQERLSAWSSDAVADGRPPPVFFVGFPCSGTALVDQMLAAHAGIVTTGERSPLEGIREDWERTPSPGGRAYPACLEDLNDDDIRHWRRSYWQRAAESMGRDPTGCTLIDKLPLNLIHLGMVKRLFPDAKVIVALRDPRDVCLSCFMQQFKATPSTVNFQRLDSTAELYGAVLDLWLHYRRCVGLAWMEYRYEDVVADMEETMRRILAFLDEAWSDDILGNRDAAGRRAISTPSYRDVTDSLHARPVGRWRNYEAHLAPILPTLRPYVEAFGYDALPPGGEGG